MAIPKGCLPSQAVPEKLKQWLEAEDFSYVQLIGELAKNTLFSYHVTLPFETEITVFQPSSKMDSIIVSAVLLLSAGQVKELRQKSKKEQEEFFSDLCFKLAPLDVELTLEGGEVYRSIVLNHQIYYDALTKDRFFKAISIIDKAQSLARWITKHSL
ncbi:MAG: hypothetical protein CW691_10535 [Candidatus Bathyarchaeum sp.]|nr:MAG: hypothetical protein CW691_10535 [Candidatus Bathyarchaeum sp.]